MALTAAMLGCLTWLVERKNSVQKYQDFIHQDVDMDVLFMGTSHVINGVFPMELWRDYGIASYNFGGHGNTLAVTYWTLRNALDYTSPKVVVMDGLRLSVPTRLYGNVENAHISFDAFPLSATKIKAAFDLTEDQMQREELLWNFSIYHNRWTEIGKNDLVPATSVEKGAESRIAVAENVVFSPIDKSMALAEDTAGVEYLRRAIEDCQERGIEVLLTYLPFPASEADQMEANRIYEIAAEYGVDYINFLDMNVVDFHVDSYDPVSHLNPSGARKVTDYLGRYIREHYDVPDRREDPDYAGWNDDYAAYMQFKINSIAGQTDFKNYLMLLQDEHLSSCVYLSENALWHGGSIYDKLLANMGVDSDRLIAGGPTLAVVDNEQNEVDYLAYGESAETSFGTVSFALIDGAPKVLVNGAVSMELAGNAAAAAMVIDDDTGRMVTSSQFAITTTAASVTKIS